MREDLQRGNRLEQMEVERQHAPERVGADTEYETRGVGLGGVTHASPSPLPADAASATRFGANKRRYTPCQCRRAG